MKIKFSSLLFCLLTAGLYAQTAQVQLIHNVMRAGTAGGPTVDIYINDSLYVESDDLAYLEATAMLDIPAGVNIQIAVAPDSSTSSNDADFIFNIGVLAEGSSAVIIANGIPGDLFSPLELAVQRLGSVVGTDSVAILAFHGAPEVAEVNINAREQGTLFENLSYGQFLDRQEMPAARYVLDVLTIEPSELLGSFVADLSDAGGLTVTVLASGFLDNTPELGLYAVLPDGTVLSLPPLNSPTLVINEVDYNQVGTDGAEFIEIKNTGDQAVSLNGLELHLINGPAGTVYDVIPLPDAELAASDYFVVCFSNAVANCDLQVSGSIQNGGTDPDGIQLRSGDLVIDAVTYDGDIEGITEGSGSGLEDGDQESFGLSRIPDGEDTQQNNVDFLAVCITPGMPNVEQFECDKVPGTDSARVQLVHNAPSAAVDVYINDTLVLSNFAFRTATPFMNIVAGPALDIALAPTGSQSSAEAILKVEDLILEPEGIYQIIATGIAGDTEKPLKLAVNDNAKESNRLPFTVEFNAFHGAPDAPTVTVAIQDAAASIDGIQYGSFSAYTGAVPGIYLLDILVASTGELLATYEADVRGLAGKTALIFASGFLDSIPEFGLFAALTDGTVLELPRVDYANIQLIHNVSDVTVDVYGNGKLLVDNLDFRDATEFLRIRADQNWNIELKDELSIPEDPAIIAFPDLQFEADEDYVVVVNGGGAAEQPIELAILKDARRAAPIGEVAFTIFHGSSTAPAIDLASDELGLLDTALIYGQFSEYYSAPAALYTLRILANNLPRELGVFAADLTALAGQAITVFASGDINASPSFGLFAALENGTVIPLEQLFFARAQIIHNAPAGAVDIYVNGELFETGLEFRSATSYFDLEADVPLDILITPIASTDTLWNAEDAVFSSNSDYILMAYGIPGDTLRPFSISIFDQAMEAASLPGIVQFAAFHGGLDAPAVDVDIRGFGNVIDSLTYGEFTAYGTAPPARLFLDLRANGSIEILATYEANFSQLAGQTALVFASGFLNSEPAFGLFAAMPDGTVVPLLPVNDLTRAQLIHNAPDAAVDIYINGSLYVSDFAFRTATAYDFVPAGVPLEVRVLPADSLATSTPIAVYDSLILEVSKTYTIVAYGIPGDNQNPFSLAVNDAAMEDAGGTNKLAFNVFHGTPDAPAIDIDLQGITTLYSNLTYGSFDDYTLIEPLSSEPIAVLDIRANGSDAVLATYQGNFAAYDNEALTVFASGLLTGEPAFGLWAARPNGEVFPLDLLTGTGNLQQYLGQFTLSPNPARGQTRLTLELEKPVRLQVQVIDQIGKIVRQSDLGQLKKGNYQDLLPLDNLPEGMYWIRLLSKEGSVSKQLMIVR